MRAHAQVSKHGAPFQFAFEAAVWPEAIGANVYELTAVFRQSDASFVSALNQIRRGRAPAAVRELLRPCVNRNLSESGGIVATRLFTHRAECATLNEQALKALGGAQSSFTARDTGRDEAALKQLQSSCPAPASLTLKVGAQVLLVQTLDAEAGLVNGTRGVVTSLGAIASSARVRFHNGVERLISPQPFALSQGGGGVVACRTQLPLALGWALSVHKSQGMSLDPVELSLRNVFECGQMYVALSRARALEGLALKDGVDWSKLRAHPRVLAWHEGQGLHG